MSKSTLFECTEEQRRQIIARYNRTPESVKDDVQAVKKWLEKQPHLPEVTREERIERFLLANKFSVELTKERIDMYYTLRSLFPEIYENREPYQKCMQEIVKVVYYVPLPKLSPDLNRIVVYKLVDDDADKFDPFCFFSHIMNVLELRLFEEYNDGEIYIIDFENTKLGHLSKLGPAALKKAIAIVEKLFTNGLKGIHFINHPSFFEQFIVLLKSILKPKLANRITVHKDLSSLYQILPKEYLPKDYGGCQKSLEELNDLLLDKMKEYTPWFDYLKTLKVNEKLRPGKPISHDILGIHGNFKKLEVD